jgi:hypothetical protein
MALPSFSQPPVQIQQQVDEKNDLYALALTVCPEGLYRRYVDERMRRKVEIPQVTGSNKQLDVLLHRLNSASRKEIEESVSLAIRDGSVFVLDTLMRLHPPAVKNLRLIVSTRYLEVVPEKFVSRSEGNAHTRFQTDWESALAVAQDGLSK